MKNGEDEENDEEMEGGRNGKGKDGLERKGWKGKGGKAQGKRWKGGGNGRDEEMDG